MHYRTILVGITVAMLGVGSAYAQEIDDMQMCQSAAAAFEAVAQNINDADVENAKSMVAQALTDCKNGKTAEGLGTINLATAMISDGKEGSHKRK